MQPVLRSVMLVAALAACHHGPAPAPPGLALAPPAAPLVTLVWVGRGEAERLEHGAWVRIPAHDYEFSVEQRRYADRWESIKTMRRRDPAYDGSAGPRLQVHTFALALAPAGERVRYAVASTLGAGQGESDRVFREAALELYPDAGWLARRFRPFDRYRITQHYRYEQGALDELVELRDGERPWVRNREHATLFGATTFPAPPTTLGRNR